MRGKHVDMLNELTNSRDTCETCAVVKNGHCKKCSRNICDSIAEEIKAMSREGSNLSWENSDTKKWQEEFWEIAKIFLPAIGSVYTREIHNTTLIGFLYLMYNCNLFYSYLGRNAETFMKKVRIRPYHFG